MGQQRTSRVVFFIGSVELKQRTSCVVFFVGSVELKVVLSPYSSLLVNKGFFHCTAGTGRFLVNKGRFLSSDSLQGVRLLMIRVGGKVMITSRVGRG